MELPISIFLFFIGLTVTMFAIGLWKKIPLLMFIGGAFLTFWSIQTDTIIMDFFIDAEGTADVYHYNVQSSTGQVLINAVTAQTQAEFASASNSMLVGDEIDCMTVWLGKAGTPPAGNLITFGVFDINNNAISVFGQMFPTDMPSSAITPYTHCLPVGESWTIANGHRIGVRYAAGDAANTITMRVDGNNPFDGIITYRTEYTTMWVSSTAQDIMMQLYLRGQEITTENIIYPFTEYPKILFGMVGAMFLLSGALIWKFND